MSDKFKVLVVDDEPGMRSGVCRALRDFTVRLPDINGPVAFDVDQASSGEEAMEKIGAGAPDILLLDHKLPGISGLEVLEHIAPSQHEDMLTVMITAYASLETAISATKRGAYDFLAKPFTPEETPQHRAKGRRAADPRAAGAKLAQEKRQVRFQFISVLAHAARSAAVGDRGLPQHSQGRLGRQRPCRAAST